MRVIQVATKSWLVIDEIYRPRFLISYGPAVHQRTFETHLLYRIDKWALERQNRIPIAWRDTHVEAVKVCENEIDRPDFHAPLRADYGSAVSTDLQRARWDQGLDPRTGEPG